jgi:hypothetical protein
MQRRVVYLALAIGRGHLMRAAILRELLAPHGVTLDLVTTTEAGRQFLATLGCPSRVLPGGFSLVYDGLQNLDQAGTAAQLAAYLGSPGRALRDWRMLQRLARGASLLVNDSLHPALLVGPRGRVPVVAVHGEDLWQATEHHFDGQAPPGLARCVSAGLRRLERRARVRLVHTLEALGEGSLPSGRGELLLPPILAAPRRAPDEVRAGFRRGERLAVVYLNPNFREAGLADTLERELGAAGYRLHAVGEGYAGRPGWLGRDPELVDSVAAADLLVAAPGMGTLAQARLFGLPLVALLTDQPEQRRNVARYARMAPVEALRPDSPDFARALRAAATAPRLPQQRPDPRQAIGRIHAVWTRTFLRLLVEAT